MRIIPHKCLIKVSETCDLIPHKCLIKVSETCDLCLRIITHRVHNVNPPQKSPRTHTKSSRESSHKHTNLVETSYIHTTISTRPGIILASRRDLCYNHTILTGSRRCTTTTISTIHTPTMHHMISKGIQISTRIMHEMHMITNHLHIDTMHDRI